MRLPLCILTLTLSLAALADACIHAPKGYDGSVEQTSQSAIVFWDAGVEDLVIKPAFQAKGSKAPASLAWVIPVPAQPTSYGEVQGKAFKDLFEAWERENRPKSMNRARGAKSAPGGIELLEPAIAGDYAIQPIKATGAQGAEALNAWLSQNGFGQVPAENMSYYVEREWIWLCVKAQPSSSSGDLKPLRVTFPSKEPVYPLKFSTHQGTFALTLWVITKQPLRSLELLPKDYGVNARQATRFRLPKSVQDCAKGTKLGNEVVLTKVTRRALTGEAIRAWKADLAFLPAKD